MTELGSKGRCFVVCPIGHEGDDQRKHSDAILAHLIDPAARECGYVAERSSDSERPGMITSQIVDSLVNAPLVIADLSFHNPNVFYELAVRHAARKPVVILCDREWSVPFDISDARMVRFNFSKLQDPKDVLDSLADARQSLVAQIRLVEESGGEVDNPISSSIDLAAWRAGTQQEKRDALILERLEGLSLDVQALADGAFYRDWSEYALVTLGAGENRRTFLELPGRPASDIPPFTKFFAEDSPGFFSSLLSENEIIPRQRPLNDNVSWVEALRAPNRTAVEPGLRARGA